MGNEGAARAWADSLALLVADSTPDARIIEGFARVVRSDAAVRANDPATAIRELDGMSLDVPPSHLAPWASGLWYAARVRVPAHIAANEPERALQWLRHGLAAFGEPDAELYGVFNRDMAYALDALGRTSEAVLHYARFVEAWADADAELQPQVAAARDRLIALTRENR